MSMFNKCNKIVLLVFFPIVTILIHWKQTIFTIDIVFANVTTTKSSHCLMHVLNKQKKGINIYDTNVTCTSISWCDWFLYPSYAVLQTVILIPKPAWGDLRNTTYYLLYVEACFEYVLYFLIWNVNFINSDAVFRCGCHWPWCHPRFSEFRVVQSLLCCTLFADHCLSFSLTSHCISFFDLRLQTVPLVSPYWYRTCIADNTTWECLGKTNKKQMHISTYVA